MADTKERNPGLIIARWGLRFLWWSIRRTFWLVGWAIVGVVSTVRYTIRGEHRHLLAPGWLYAAALISSFASTTWWWLAAAAALDLTLWPRPAAWWRTRRRQILSERERQLLVRTFAGIAAVLSYHLPITWGAPLLAGVVLAGAVPWWRGRQVRPVPRPENAVRWEEEAVPALPALAGFWVGDFDPARDTGVWQLAESKASDVEKLDEDVERVLNARRGTVTIASDPRLTVRQVRVTFSSHDEGSRLRLFDGCTLTRDGWVLLSYAKGALPLYGRLWWEEGGLNVAVIAPPGEGKGSVIRVLAINGALSDRVAQFGACGKQGQGIGYLQRGFAAFADNHEESVDLIHGYLMAVRERARRYARMGRDSFIPGPGDPYMMLYVDEPHWIFEYEPRVISWFEEISGTSRSAGAGIVQSLHKGDGPGYGNTKIRSNVISNGWRALGSAADNQARTTGKQSSNVDMDSIPKEPGWFIPVGSRLGDQPEVAGRTLWVPNRSDYDKYRATTLDDVLVPADEFAPYGFVEDWLTRTVHPELHPETVEALRTPDPMQEMRRERARQQEIREEAEAASKALAGFDVATLGDVGARLAKGEPLNELSGEDQAHIIEALRERYHRAHDKELSADAARLVLGAPPDAGAERPTLTLVDEKPPPEAWRKIRAVLEQVHPSGLLRGQIATRTKVSARHVSTLLAEREGTEVVKNEKSEWSLAS